MDNKSNELFWNANIDTVKRGLIEEDGEFKCIICEEAYEKGRIYEINAALYDAKRAAEKHIEQKHGSILEYLLNKHSKSIKEGGLDYVKAFEEIEDYTNYLIR